LIGEKLLERKDPLSGLQHWALLARLGAWAFAEELLESAFASDLRGKTLFARLDICATVIFW